jgi:CheY-like chemotaxis protein
MKTRHYSLLVSDIGMPEIDGYELIRRVRALQDLDKASIRAIALTAFARAEDRARALTAGYDLHLAKPIHSGDLAQSISTLRTGA